MPCEGQGGNRGILPRAPSVRGPPNSAELAQIEKYDKTGLQLAMIKYALKFASKQQRQKKKKKKNKLTLKSTKKRGKPYVFQVRLLHTYATRTQTSNAEA